VLLIILLVLWLRSRRDPDYLIGEPDQDVRENIGFYDEEGAGRIPLTIINCRIFLIIFFVLLLRP